VSGGAETLFGTSGGFGKGDIWRKARSRGALVDIRIDDWPP